MLNELNIAHEFSRLAVACMRPNQIVGASEIVQLCLMCMHKWTRDLFPLDGWNKFVVSRVTQNLFSFE